jgi:hypothetical protein
LEYTQISKVFFTGDYVSRATTSIINAKMEPKATVVSKAIVVIF